MDQQKQGLNKPALGKGLASLLPQAGIAQNKPAQPTQGTTTTDGVAVQNKDRQMGIMMCSLEDIVPNTYQPRVQFDDATIEELSNSIKENGLIQPLIVRKAEKGYQLIAGERRWRAAKLAGLKQVPVVVRRSTDQEALELAIIENVQREDLNCVDTALAYQQLIQEFNLTQESVATKVGKDRVTVANHLRLLKLPQQVIEWLKQGTLTYGHGKSLAGLETADVIGKMAEHAVDLRWSVRELEKKIQEFKEAKTENGTAEVGAADPSKTRLKNIGNELSQKFSTKVQVKGTDQKGKIVIDYVSLDDLNRLIERLHKAN